MKKPKWHFIFNGRLITVRANTQYGAYKRARKLLGGFTCG